MPPPLAAFICLVVVLGLFRREAKEQPDASAALWIPTLWMFLAGSRYVSAWLNLGQPISANYDEGSPLDAGVFAALIILGVVVLWRRVLRGAALLEKNKLVALYFLYCIVSLSWSDQPSIGMKRLVKEAGNPVMALLILTDPRPLQALGIVMRRLAFLALPLSVLFVRYYPELGRTYHQGVPMFTGIGNQKNALGQICLVIGLYFLWQLLVARRDLQPWSRARRVHLYLLTGALGYLLTISDSKTSLSALLVGAAVLWCSTWGFVRARPTRLLGTVAALAVSAFVLESVFGLYDTILEQMGRNPDLTNRTGLWELLMSFGASPWVGTGFMSFWSGERMQSIWQQLGAEVLQAHSGYIEQYLNLGYVGVAFVVMMAAKGMLDARRQSRTMPELAALRMAIIVAALTYNYTEAAFYGVNNMWVLLLFAVLNQRARSDVPQVTPTAIDGPASREEPRARPPVRSGSLSPSSHA